MAMLRFLIISMLLGLTACTNLPDDSTAAGIPEAPTGNIKLSRWDNLSGSDLNTLLTSSKYPEFYNRRQIKYSFYYRPNLTNFGARIRAVIFPDTSGLYSLKLNVKGSADVWLSTDESEANKRLILRADQPDETSDAPVLLTETTPVNFTLESGKRYYVEVRFKGVKATDYISLNWLKPGTTQYVTIPGSRLAAYPRDYYEDDAKEFGYAYTAGYRSGYIDSQYGIAYNDDYPVEDSDRDSIPDKWENALGYNPNDAADAQADDDTDGLSTAYEFWAGTEPFVADSDADGVLDAAELLAGSDPMDDSSVDSSYQSTDSTDTTTDTDTTETDVADTGTTQEEQTDYETSADYIAGNNAVIELVDGTIRQGNTVTVHGAFSANRNGEGQLLFLGGDEGSSGSLIKDKHGLKQVGTSMQYYFNTSKSYSGNSSLYTHSPANTYAPQTRYYFEDGFGSEAFVSYRMYIKVNAYNGSAQLKHGRLIGQSDVHTSKPYAGGTWLPNTGGTGRFTAFLSGNTYYASSEFSPDAKMKNHWVRHILHFKLDKSNGIRFYRVIDEDGKQHYKFSHSSIGHLSGNSSENVATSWFPKRNLNTATNGNAFLGFYLPFYKRAWSNFEWWIDNLYINDTAERVEVTNSPNWTDAVAERVVQNTITRTNNSIKLKLELGPLSSSNDDLYLYVFNSDGTVNAKGYLLSR